MKYIAADFGAGSGRVIVGSLAANGTIELEEIHRFANRQISLHGRVYWDFLSLFEELKTGLRKAFALYGDEIKSIGVDTWGVDYGLIGADGQLLSNPVCYRDARTAGMLSEAFALMPKNEIFAHAGNQFMEINTAFQLLSAVKHNEPSLQVAERLLFTPDLFNYFLTGRCANEYTIASTSQLLNSKSHEWDNELFAALGLPKRLMQEIVYPGTVLGTLTPEVAAEVGGNAEVVAVGSHDTASAFASILDDGDDWAFISSGTWSLMGVPTDEPNQSAEALRSDFTNEGTVDGRIRFLKNITGLWLIQQLVKEWERSGSKCDYSQLVREAEASSLESYVNVDDARFTNPKSMSQAITDYCTEHSMQAPESQGEFMRCVCLSLAHKYAEVKQQLEACTGKCLKKIYIVGGGSKNELLNRLTAELTGCEVIKGYVEATAIGNITIQAKAAGEID